ncbi:MAG: DUF494 domain-containing protein [Alysiella sp.]|uniref:DUF494 domain-containing protein n=1 Tax=Alysiella sp. TaxID=1872483 RepID=UPI0026DCD313|nr:DUF494 domain-containing protein [Alysiella sp.]MDO4433619.1 DUF494 domain-containing protein [Alysiella sp.]
MKQVVAFLIEHFSDIQACPSGNDLGVILEHAGFEAEDIGDALVIMELLCATPMSNHSGSQTHSSVALRVYHDEEMEVLSPEIRGLLHFLTESHTLNAEQREFVIHALMHLPYEDITLETTKILSILILWAHRSELPVLIGDELMAVLHGKGIMQ